MNAMFKNKRVRVAFLVLVLPILFGGTYFLSLLIFGSDSSFSILSKKIDSTVSKTIAESEIDPSCVQKNLIRKQEGHLDWEQIEVVVNLDAQSSLQKISRRLQKALNAPAVTLETNEAQRDVYRESELSLYYEGVPLYQILLRQKNIPPPAEEPADEGEEPAEDVVDNAPKIALIVDDVGYDIERALELLNLRHPMTISIFPQLLYSRHIAESAHKMGYEIMMHLPMESDENLRRNPGFIMGSMSRSELFEIMDKDLESIPYVSGVNNHQGSKMTRDQEAMAVVMSYLAEKKLYFIDSRTTNDSVAYEVARAYGLKASENDVFLDNEKDSEYIKERLALLVERAEEKGKAIGICHVHPVTIEVLREMLPVIEQKGIKLVYASEVVE